MHCIGVKEGKKNWKKKAEIKISILIFNTQQSLPPSRCIQSLKILAQIGAEKSVTEFFVGEKEKWKNTGSDKQYVANSLIHSTTCHT